MRLMRPRVMVVVALSVMIFTATVSVLVSLRSAPEAWAGGGDYTITEAGAPTIFSSQVDAGLLDALVAQPQITGARADTVTFTSWNGTSFVARGIEGAYGDLEDYAGEVVVIPQAPHSSCESGIIGERLMDRLGVTPPCKVALVGSYSAKIGFVDVNGWFCSDGPLDDELIISADLARYLSGMPEGKASFITVTTSDPAWLSGLLSPDNARFTMFDMHMSRATVAAGEPLEVSATVRNWGATEGMATVEISLDGAEEDSIDMTLDPSSDGEVVFGWPASGLGYHTVSFTLSGDFPVELNATFEVVQPYLVVSAPSKVALDDRFDVGVGTYDGLPAEGAEVSFMGQSATAGPGGTVSFLASELGEGTVEASLEGFTDGSAAVSVYDPASFPDEFLPSIASFTVTPSSIMESEETTGVLVVENGGTVAGHFEVEVTVDSSVYATLDIPVEGMSSATGSITLSDLAAGAHTVQAGSYSVEVAVAPWFADEPDLVELVVRYGGSSSVSSSSSLPLYQAAKISEGNVAVALFSIGAVSALVSALAMIAVCAKEVHEGRRTLGVLKTVGASSGAIRKFVFPQALFLGLGGGVAGVLLGIGAVAVLSSFGGLMVFGHELALSLDVRVALLSLLGAVLISMASALATAELAARETTIASIKRLQPEASPPLDVDEILRDE